MNSVDSEKRKVAWTIFAFLVCMVVLLSQQNSHVSADEINETIPALLDVWDSSLYSKIFINETVTYFANYTTLNSTLIAGASCLIGDTELFFNSSIYLYTHESAFAEPGNYTYSVICGMPGYQNLSVTREIEILPLYLEYGNFSINESGNQTVNETNSTHEENSTEIDYTLFSIKTDRQLYDPGDVVVLIINANNGSDTYVTINTPSNISYVYVFTNATYPLVQQYSLTGISGDYIIEGINYFGNNTNINNSLFSVRDLMSVNIQVDKDNVFENEIIGFKAVIAGALGDVNMIWRMDDGTEKYSEEFEHSYASAGEYNVVLIATDQGGNQEIKTKKITVNRQLYLKVRVLENSTSDIISNASVRLDSTIREVNSSGEAEFTVTNKTYNLRAYADGYYTYDEDIKLNNSLYFTVYLLKQKQSVPPIVSLLSPENASISQPVFRFKQEGGSNANCTLYTSDGGGWWSQHNTTYGLLPGAEAVIGIEIEEGRYLWRVSCINEDGTGTSPVYMINITREIIFMQEKEADITYDVVENIYSIIPDFATYSPDEKKIVEYLNMEQLIKEAKRKLDMANRDLFNLRYQSSTDSLIAERDKILNRIEEIKDETPLSVVSKGKADFIKYLDEQETEQLFEEYLKLSAIELKSSEKRQMLELAKMLQKQATIQTIAYDAEITYISGRKEDITLVTKKIDLPSMRNRIVIEFFPKDIAASVNDIVFLTPPDKILSQNAVVEFKLEKLTELAYYIKGRPSLDKIPKIKSLIVSTKADEESIKEVTGFAILGGSGFFERLGFSYRNKLIFIIELIVLAILIGVYVYYRKISNITPEDNPPREEKPSVWEEQVFPVRVSRLLDDGEKQKIFYLNATITRGNTHLAQGSIKDAALCYYEAKFLYDLLGEEQRIRLFDKMAALHDGIALKHIENMLDDAIIAIACKKKEEALSLYEEIGTEFEKLSDDYKEKIYRRCCELALHLSRFENESI